MFFNKVRHLPQTKGPYVPGCIDIMLEYSQSGIFARLYYPTKEKRDEVDSSKWIQWAPDENYFVGTARALLYLPLLARCFYWFVSDYLSPVVYGAKVNKDKRLPCIVLSPGYAANRMFYSIISSELASRGYLVAVIEHRDLTSGYTFFYKNKNDAEADIKTPIHPKLIYPNPNFYEERNKQVQYRANECSKLLDLLIDLNKGKIPHNVLDDVNKEKHIQFDWGDFAGLLDLSTLTMAGHSFGGATALYYTLTIRKEFKQGLLLDPWMYPIKHENLAHQIAKPLLFINSETFHTSDSVREMEKFMKGDDKEMFTVLHTSHEIQSDVGCITGFWMNLLKRKLIPYQAAEINNALILRFLKRCTGNQANVEDCCGCLKKEDKNIAVGLTKPWTIVGKD